MRDILGMGEADCDVAIDLYHYHVYSFRDVVVALEVGRVRWMCSAGL